MNWHGNGGCDGSVIRHDSVNLYYSRRSIETTIIGLTNILGVNLGSIESSQFPNRDLASSAAVRTLAYLDKLCHVLHGLRPRFTLDTVPWSLCTC